jgi:transposase
MEAQTVDTLPPIAADHDPVRCLLAIELSKKSWIIAVNSPLVDRIGRYSLEVSDWECLLERIERIRMRVARELNRPVEVISCYEAGYDGFWLHRLLEAHGVRNYVIDVASLHVDRRARRTKTDHIDAVLLLRSLSAAARHSTLFTTRKLRPTRAFPSLRGRLSPARLRRRDQRFCRNVPLAVRLPGHLHRKRALPRQDVGRALARAEQTAKIGLSIARRLHAVTNRIDRVGRLDRPALALVVLDDQCKEIEAVGFRRVRLGFVFDVLFDLLERGVFVMGDTVRHVSGG